MEWEPATPPGEPHAPDAPAGPESDGSPAGEAAEPAAPPEPAGAGPWGLRGAVYVTLLSILAQVALGLLLSGAAWAALVILDPGVIRSREEMAQAILEVTILPLAVLSSLFTVGLIWLSVVRNHRRPFLDALGLRRATGFALSGSFLLGSAAAVIYTGVALSLPPRPDQELGGPLAKLAQSSLFGQVVWTLLAVVMAPMVEELLFRGYAYLGARRTLGAAGAGAVVTVVFVMLHVTETGSYLPALAGIATLASILVVIMERTGNLTRCIACHLGYNATLAALMFSTGL